MSSDIQLPGVHVPLRVGIVGDDSPPFTITYPQRCAFAVIAAVQKAREKFVAERGPVLSHDDDLDTPRVGLGTATTQERLGMKTGQWRVSRRAALGLKRLGLVEFPERHLYGTFLYRHAVLTPKGEKLAAQWPEDVAVIEAMT